MRVRKLSLIAALVVLSAILLAAPVQAGRAVTQFTFQITDVGIDCPKYVMTGPIGHFECVATGIVVSDEASLNGGQFSWVMHGPNVFPNPHAVVPGSWGPVPATWQIIMPGEPPSGWEGTSSCPPYSGAARARGNGFGAHRSEHLTWNVTWQDDIENAVFRGEIAETE